jgi:hypothetical protein
MTTTHYSDAQGNYVGGFADGAQPPEGAIERPAPPRADAVWGGSGWAVPQSPQPTLEERRGAAFLERVPFLLGLLGMGKITDSIADEASDGSWPSAWDSDIASLPLADRMAVKALWKKADTVEYYGPFTTTLAMLAQTESAPVAITQAEQDTLFGIEP